MHKLLMSIAQELLSARKHNSHHVKGWEKYFIFICNNSCFALSIVNIEPKKTNALLKDVAKFYEKHHELGKPFTVRHFVAMGVPRRACYYVLKKFEASGRFSDERKRGSGRKTCKNERFSKEEAGPESKLQDRCVHQEISKGIWYFSGIREKNTSKS